MAVTATTPRAPPTGSGAASGSTTVVHPLYVNEHLVEFLLTELSNYAQRSCAPLPSESSAPAVGGAATESNVSSQAMTVVTAHQQQQQQLTQEAYEERLTVAAEMAAAKLERMGWSVGYRLTERLAQNKTWQGSSAASAADPAAAVAAQQLEAVKFLCKEVWMQVFHKQIDKLQTNHRGVFVLKDLDLPWMARFPSHTEPARVAALRLLAFPCGLIRGVLANLGIHAAVSCDFLSQNNHMAACSFNIKVK